MKYKIIVDSSSDLLNNHIVDESVGFEVIPLSIYVDNVEFIDNDSLNCRELLTSIKNSTAKASTSCPSPQLFINACTADYNFIVTISSKLSTTYNCACLAANLIEDNKEVFVIDSLATSGAIALITEKLYELIKKDMAYDDICKEIMNYRNNNYFFFILDDFQNLIKNGRMTKLTAVFAKLTFIKPICIAEDGEIKIHKIIRTKKRALLTLIEEIKNLNIDFSDRKCIITHCFDEDNAALLKMLLEQEINFKDIQINTTRGLCSFYALDKGLLISF